MPLNVHFENSHLLAVPGVKSQKNTMIHHSNRLSTIVPLQIQNVNLKSSKQGSKHSSSKNTLKSPRNHRFQTLELRAMLKKAKEVSPCQTFLPRKSPKPHSGVNINLERNQIRKNSGSSKCLDIQASGNLKQQVKKLDKCRKFSDDIKVKKQDKDATNFLNEQMNDEIGSLSQIIFFGDGKHDQEVKIVVLQQKLSKGGELQCQQLLNHLQKV